ncbi:acetylornithine deacetylase [Roseibium sp. RKSG952]|uniref:acetylornithine deacetylase n=1 Tax=Roseibium sp. RKSG952 TaxID=2529384 RepID=UPI0012BCAAA1|nr:acetylornithine deacetylase [Roseibium sp. RKSG952]MTI01967.1 acetylornithine deacetylase [Roseibium sp. RKSG952]
MLDRSIDILGDLIAFPTVSIDSNLDLIKYLSDRFEALGARCSLTADNSGTKANLFATLGPDLPGGVMLSGHTDVVPVADQDWTTDPFELTRRDGKLFGRGTCDMKGFIAANLALAETLDASALKQPLHFAFTYDEETGCLGAQSLIRDLAQRGIVPDIAIVGEPTEMRVIEGHKGCYEYTARFAGLEGHGSAPDAGVNAAEYAARYVAKLLELRENLKARTPVTSKFDPPWSTINIGRISGGVAHNVIVGKAEVDWEMRPVQASDADFVKGALTDYVDGTLVPEMKSVHPKASIELEIIAEVAGLEPMDDNAARDLVAKLTGANGADLVAFGTEAGLFQQLGSNTIVCGPGSIREAHKSDEYLEIEQLELCCRMLRRLGETLVN